MIGSSPAMLGSTQAPSLQCARALEIFQRAAAWQLGSTGQCHISTRGVMGNPGLPRCTCCYTPLVLPTSSRLSMYCCSVSSLFAVIQNLCTYIRPGVVKADLITNTLQAQCTSKSQCSGVGHPTLCSSRVCWAGMAWAGLQHLDAPRFYH